MKTPRPRRLAVSIGLLLAVASVASAREAADNGKAGQSAGPRTEAALKWAMPAAEVRQIMGEPHEIRALAAPVGKAEVLVYKRPVGERFEQMVVGTVPIMITTYEVNGSCTNKIPGRAIERKIGETVLYGTLRVTTEEKVEVLLFNDHFVTSKVTHHEVRSYN